MIFFRRTTLALALLVTWFHHVSGRRSLLMSSDQQCVGTFYDQTRLKVLSEESIAALVTDNFTPDGLPFNFATRQVTRETSFSDKTNCLAERHRVRELIEGVPIFGADFVVTLKACSKVDHSEHIRLHENTLVAVNPSLVRSADGYMVSSVAVPTGYRSKRSKEEAVEMVARLYQVREEKVTTLSMEIYPTATEDYRAWIGTVLVDTTPGEARLYQTVIDDETEEIILQCEIAGLYEKQQRMESIRRRAQYDQKDDSGGDDEPLDASLCQSCTIRRSDIVWDETANVECDVETLYMNNEGKKSRCVTGTDASGNYYIAPGAVPELHYSGTLDCGSFTDDCKLSPVPSCRDAIYDVQYGAVNFLKYMQEHMGIMGGLVKDANNPIPVLGRVHYDYRYCNAFYVPGEYTVTFGDCNCQIFTPLVSTDVVVHEIVHGMTSESSNLIYFMESGGLNEAYSDIMACAVEHTIDDTDDQPDFTVGEALAHKFLRHMEFPTEDGNSIDSYCSFEVGMNVHYSSGYLNRAYVKAVRQCEKTCGTTSECAVLLANTFMYTNLETLSMGSNFKDAAQQTCRDVGDYFAARSPTTRCTIEQVKDAVVMGFGQVGLAMNANECKAEVTCEKMNIFEATWAACQNLYEFGEKICQLLTNQFKFWSKKEQVQNSY